MVKIMNTQLRCDIVPVTTNDGKAVYADGLQLYYCDTHYLFLRGVNPRSCHEYRAIRKLVIREHEEQQQKVGIK